MNPIFSRKRQKRIVERKTETSKRRKLAELPLRQVAICLLLWLVTSYLFYGGGLVNHIEIAKGQSFHSTVVAAVDFECEDLLATQFKRKEAADAVAPVFNIDPAPLARALARSGKLFDQLAAYSTADTNNQQAIVRSLGDLLLGTPVSSHDFTTLFPEGNVASAKAVLATNLVQAMSAGILSPEYRGTMFQNDAGKKLSIRNDARGTSREAPLGSTYSARSAVDEIAAKLAPLATPGRKETLDALVGSLVAPNLGYNKTATDALRQAAAEAIPPVTQSYAAGTPLVRAGEQATDQNILLLQKNEQARRKNLDAVEASLQILGNSLLLLAGLVVSAVIMRIVAPKTTATPAHLLLLAILSLMTLASGRLLLQLSVRHAELLPSYLLMYLVPYALPALLAGILLGASAAVGLGLWTSFATAVLFQQSFNVFALGMLVSIAASCTARDIHRRSNFFRAGIWVCAVAILYALASAIINRPALPVLAGQLAAATVGGMLSTLLVLLLIPVFEKLFKITTDITLLELSDMGHPLLQKMAIQAPGTYHHSLMVATLAQNAAEAIGANALLVRVSAYYHDIGKLAKPEFFTENIQQRDNPHDDLSPHMSALVIVSHVKEGLTLARRHRLPPPILDAIEQHHGNGLISYFYHKAKTRQQRESVLSGTAETINDSDFRYGGRPPVTPEMAILSLADASEAASRSLEKPTPQKIANLVNDIFDGKIRDGQMDYADLTMAQINLIKRSFIFSLSNMLHGRIPYPKDNENKSGKPAKASPNTPPEDQTAG